MSSAPSAKRVKVEGEGGEEEEDEMEGGELDISVGGEAVETMTMVQAEAVDAEKKAAMIRSGKTLEERQEEFKEMLLERGVSKPLAKYGTSHLPLAHLHRCLPSRRGTRSCRNLCLILATCSSTQGRGRAASRSSYGRGPRRRGRRNAAS